MEIKECNPIINEKITVKDLNEEAVERGGPKFNPQLYLQRYTTVRDTLYKIPGIEKVVDFGCSEGKFIKYLKNLPFVTEISCVDVHSDSLFSASHFARPLVWDHLFKRYKDLHIKIYCGSVLERDVRFCGYDAVTCIELIEHLNLCDIDAFVSNIFGFIRPKVAIFTTPNQEFNILFPQVKEFRHWDHKFEWTRDQFNEWCESVIGKYPDYSYTAAGIGEPPPESAELGCCSQMAIFQRISTTILTSDSEFNEEPYRLIEDYLYPGRND